MMNYRGHREEKGFALIIVVMIVAAISIVAVTLLNFVNLDVVISGQNRRSFEARTVADGASMEMIDLFQLNPNLLPDFTANNLQTPLADPRGMYGAAGLTPPGTSYFIRNTPVDDANMTLPQMTFTSDIRLLRYVPITESSLNWSRALFYEIRTLGEVNGGESTGEARVEVWQLVSYAPGTLLPRMHGR